MPSPKGELFHVTSNELALVIRTNSLNSTEKAFREILSRLNNHAPTFCHGIQFSDVDERSFDPEEFNLKRISNGEAAPFDIVTSKSTQVVYWSYRSEEDED